MATKRTASAAPVVALAMSPKAPKAKPEAKAEVADTSVNRDNYMHMGGDALRAFAHRIGIARSDAARMSDEKLKEQCRYAISRHYEEA